MASYISIPRDLSKVKTKVFFNLTRRQLVCFGSGAAAGLPVFFIIKHLGTDISSAVMGMMVVMIPFFLFAMYEKNGQPLEKILNKFISFRDYTPEELTQIFLLFCSKHGYRASRPSLEYVLDYFTKKCASKQENFANAREVRNLFEYGISRQANRVMLMAVPTQDNLTLLKREDLAGENTDYGKQQYLAQLRNVFAKQGYINVKFDDIKVVRHGANPNFYGVTLIQHYNSSTYSDEGILFLVWDFTNPDEPRIEVRTWQPMATDDKDVFTLNNFKIL